MLGTLRESFVSNVSRWPDQTAVIGPDCNYTFGELDARVNRLANMLAHLGVRKGDAVGLLLHNCAEFAIGFLACQKLGAISSCLNYRLAAASIGYAVSQEHHKALLFNSQFSAAASELMKTMSSSCEFICVGGPVPAGAAAERAVQAARRAGRPRAPHRRLVAALLETAGRRPFRADRCPSRRRACRGN